MIYKFTQQIDLPAKEIERRLVAAYDLDPRQVHARYISRIMPTAPGEKIIEIKVDEPHIPPDELSRVLGINESTLQSVVSETVERKEISMSEIKPKPTSPSVPPVEAQQPSILPPLETEVPQVPGESADKLSKTFQELFFDKFLEGINKRIEKLTKWLTDTANTLSNKVQGLINSYKSEVEAQNKKIVNLEQQLGEIKEDEKNKAEAVSIKTQANEESLKKIRGDITELQGKLAKAGNIFAPPQQEKK